MVESISNIVDSVNWIIWESFIKPRVIILLLALFILWLYFFVSMKLWNLSQNVEKKIVYQYDNIFYLLSLYYNDHFETLKACPWLIVFKGIIRSGKSKYIPNKIMIKDTVSKIEDKLWTKIVPDEERNKLSKLFKKYKIRNLISKLLKFIIILIIIFLASLLILIITR